MTDLEAPPRIEHRFAPQGGCLELFLNRSPELLVSGPAGTGKSRACLEKLHFVALHNPGMRGLIVRKTHKAMTGSALVTFREKVLPEAIRTGLVKYYGGSGEKPAAYLYRNGSTIQLTGMDAATKIMSTEFDCIVGGTLVDSPSPVERCYSRPYSGQLITITTARGHQLTGTPNHPVLTPHGWVALNGLFQGDHVLSRVAGQPLATRAKPQVADQPTPIAQVAGALAKSSGGRGRTERLETVPMDFHGDTTHGYVDVVSALGLFEDRWQAEFGDPVADLYGAWAQLEQTLLMGDSAGVESMRGGGGALRTLAGTAELAHPLTVGGGASPRVGGALPALGELALPLGVDPHARLPFGERVSGGTPHDTTGSHLLLEPGDADVDGLGYLHQPPLPGEVAADRILDVSVSDAGPGRHVYNLQTEASWYYADNIISHNCIYVQEAIELTEDDWEALTTRLRNRRVSFQQLIADTNPSTPTHWLKQRANEGKTTIIESRHEDNPTLVNPDGTYTPDGAEYIAKLDALSGPRFYRLRQGKWVAAEGVIYEDYDDAVHLIDPFPIPDDWPRWWGVDFGFIHPFVLQCWAEDPDGRLYLYREIYMTRRLVSDHARTILDIVAPLDDPAEHRSADTPTWAGRTWIEPVPSAIVCDHDAEGRATLEDELGMSTAAAHKAVKEGIEAVQLRLRDPGDGKPRLFMFRDCTVEVDQSQRDAKRPTCTAEEIPGYVWGDKAKEGPVKNDDDGDDTMRYVVAEVDLGARPNFRSFDE